MTKVNKQDRNAATPLETLRVASPGRVGGMRMCGVGRGMG